MAPSLGPGTRLGAFEVLSLLGSGGMGDVYRARDTVLKREVALKVLPEAFAGDAERVARFTREAEVLASLNHPHIAQIYGVAQHEGVHAIVMELVDGEDLSRRLARGAIPLAEALPMARQIAEALEAAHEHGVIHRDLKPANIKLRDDGTVKVLDFGLAKATDQGSGLRAQGSRDLASSPTMTSPAALSAQGVILGTAAYMSPEQARGKAVDRRADIWAFGCVLFEMLTGRRAFTGETVTDVLAAVIERDSAMFSPDGRWLAYVSNDSGRDEVYAQPYPGGGAKRLVSTAGGREPVWSRDGREIFFRTDGRVWSARVTAGDAFSIDPPVPLFADTFMSGLDGAAFYDVAPDGRFLMVGGEAAVGNELHVVLNWAQELEARAGDAPR